MTSSQAVPPDTISSDPHLAPLSFNGGPTLTHLLMADSPAIDAGNNLLGLSTDQRGGDFARVVGTAADIGSLELTEADTANIIFFDGFDRTPGG